ncbi:uncharacterized protein LOC143510856 [Brachyhypopomus gauderio]|uniref:uncharacterized protein LOC143510856 n=1 Tax=Brachyhypopomus gauderio TaxID=698409 RepID=UPI0040430993
MAFYKRCLQDLPKITINDVQRIIQASTAAPRSKREKGFKMYVSSYIDNYEVSNKDPGTGRVSVRATCHRSMRKHEKPHNLRIVFEDSSLVQLIEAECSCVAGTALCNHNVALLYQTAHYSQLNLAAVPPVLSYTETEQCWHKPRIMKGRSVDLARNKVVHEKTLVHHNCSVGSEEFGDSRQLKDFPVAAYNADTKVMGPWGAMPIMALNVV